ncbi:MAG: XRE family transcriptional regulator [Gammaproteobacteria bacterium]|nr:XRE family transcriptional regulator [Gammaproteobacteria bacterium]
MTAKTKSDNNIFADMGFEETEARELQFRSFLMIVIVKYVKAEGLTQKEAAQKLGVTQSRISNLKHGKIDLFSVSMLLVMLERAGFRIYENIQINAPNLFSYHDIGKTLQACADE